MSSFTNGMLYYYRDNHDQCTCIEMHKMKEEYELEHVKLSTDLHCRHFSYIAQW